MTKKFINQKITNKAFTLIEMTIVLVIMWIMLMATVYMSGEQIQKVKDKSVKEAILSEMQTRYARNLWSSSFAWTMYDTLNITFSWGENKIDFKYNAKDSESWKENTFTDKFVIEHILTNYDDESESMGSPNESIQLTYTPYKIFCKIWESDDEETPDNKNAIFIIRINNGKNYCFEILQKNCRLTEMSESKCKDLTDALKPD